MASETDTLKKDMADLRASIDALTKDVSTMSRSFADDAKNGASKKAEELRDNINKVAGQARDKSKESVEAVSTSVAENPLRSLVFAFGAGVVISQLLQRRGH